MTITTLLLIAIVCGCGAWVVTIDAWLNTQTNWHAAGFFGLAVGCVAGLLAAAWRAWA